MNAARRLKLEAAFHKELSDLVAREVKDPRVTQAGLLTVTRVRVSEDGRHADVLVSFVGGSDDERVLAAALGALTAVAGFLRGAVARRLSLKRAPLFTFIHDKSAEFGEYLDQVIRRDREGREEQGQTEGEDGGRDDDQG